MDLSIAAPRALKMQWIAVALLFVSSSVFAGGGQSLSISSTSTQGLAPASMTISLDSTDATEGYVLAVAYDDSQASVSDLSTAGTVTESSNSELVVPEILSGGFTLGVVVDAEPPFDGHSIPAGSGQALATITVTPMAVVSVETDIDFSFSDNTLNNPPLANIIVQGGMSIGAADGLGLNGGTLTLNVPPPATMSIEDGSATADGEGSTGDARVMLDNSLGGVQGFVTAISHDSGVITLEAISTGADTEAAGAEFQISNLYANGGTFGVVLDFQTPFEGQTIPEGDGVHLASYTYSCNNENIYVEGEPTPASETSALTLTDGVLGSPTLDNVIVVGGLSISPLQENGTFTCDPIAFPAEDTTLWMETEFDEGSGNYAYHGQTGDLCFFYADEDDYIQGFTFTVCYDCNLTIHEDSWEFNGSILNQVGVEYTAVQVDDDPDDGDGCELVVALLLDALPPFEGQTLPQTVSTSGNSADGRLLVGKMRITVDMDAECNEDQLIEWCNDINGTGEVNLYNNVVIDFESIQIYERNDTLVHVVPEEIFQRGDCNSDDKVDLADTATMLANQFNGLAILCPDACDSNDDGHLNMADAVHLLNWLFKFGDPPPAPGPIDDGPDATQDDMLPVCDSDDTNC
ncbi:MAG: hypothetical protein DSY81_09820 [Bacillota bacterium]|nr:MAG: hypothetical protein DSY92_03705 [Planctomycetota bacterium]RUA08294.1 MAG: hypothetical protein DSY81_09820 [Bacillota bacterium]